MPEVQRNLSPGECVGHYQILEVAGAGGMGVVYKAFDQKLQRTVALKFLPTSKIASADAKERFLKEARAASSLDHPNIGVIHGIEELSAGHSYIVMAFYLGMSLADEIRRGPLPLEKGINFANQMLCGLQYAHNHKIVHRDVKPSNVMVTPEGIVKIVDFGLAGLIKSETETVSGDTAGTIGYMSPEQTLGKPVDQRADIWAWAIVLVEMLTGQNPYLRDNLPSTISAILSEPPQGIEELPASLHSVIYRALAKRPINRYQNFEEIIPDFESASKRIKLSMVGPDDFTQSPDSTNSKKYKAAATGSYLTNRIPGRIVALVGVLTALLTLVLIFATPLQKVFLSRTSASKPAAYEQYLKALGFMQRYDHPDNLNNAIELLKQATQTDPHFALAYSQLGEAYRLKYQLDQDSKWLDAALSNCQKAAELDPRVMATYVTLGRIHALSGQHDLAVHEFQRVLDSNPRDVGALAGMARSYEDAGHIDEAEATYAKAVALKPDYWDTYDELGLFYDRQGKYLEAVTQLRQAAVLTPDNAQIFSNLGAAYSDSGDPKLFPMAEEALKKSIALGPNYSAYANLGNLYYMEKRYAESAAMTEKALQLNSHDYLVWNNLVAAYKCLNEAEKINSARDKMQALLEQAAKIKPQDALAQSLLAIVYAEKGRRRESLARIETTLALTPDDSQALENIGIAYEKLGERSLSMKYITEAIHKGLTVDEVKNEPDLRALVATPEFARLVTASPISK